ncbi:GlxA family transcriptional regulator [Dinghuibacter silviterrae]|uniref:AraC family transcriptional regulator with amidase-like domain n=1 Tax=Dinghuibacter silviterrae TaxID=1539049 RepID=A0A4R8DFA5_9BACT|nr:GlxA family transcriptional regulator [Dinghuibacter silviterrae]TDW96261.1 AraC family transcriptional regulator with amidase-like domain [Dinghuibacter silviterrae]
MSKEAPKLIVVIPMPDIFLLDIAGPCDVFMSANRVLNENPGMGAGGYELLLASPVDTKKVVTKSGVEIGCPALVSEIDRPIDTLIVAGFSRMRFQSGHPFFHWLKKTYPKVRRIGSVCIGTIALAEAGILDGKNATTHWEFSQEFQYRYPAIKVDTNPFYTRDGNVYTSGGVSSGIDLALALVEEDYGREVALSAARKLVLPLKRPGFQSQFSTLLQVHSLENSIAGRLHPWLIRHLAEALSVEQLAERCNMSVRNFNRVFQKETGLTPAKFVEKLRIEVARKYLEDSDLTMDQIAEKCGLGGLVSMRRTFMRHIDISPSDYRRSFRTSLHTLEI